MIIATSKKFLALTLSLSLFAPMTAHAFSPGYLLSDFELTDRFSMDIGSIQQVLSRGTLSHFITEDIDGRRRYAADIIWRAGQRNGISQKVIITMLQKEQSLIEDSSPNQGQFDWAMGYGICDNCNHNTPAAQRFKGFAKQINSATLQLAEGYMVDLATVGQTIAGFAPGRDYNIDGTIVTIANDATAALYTYTPHLHGNKNFVTIYNRYFSQQFPTGTLLQDGETGGVYLIQFGKKRPFFSKAALYSRYNPERVIIVDPGSLASFEVGLPIAFPNYSLLRDGQTTYLLVDDILRPFESAEVIRSLGFSPDEILEVTHEEVSPYEQGAAITNETKYPNGIVFQHTGGTFFYVEDGIRHIIGTEAILNNRLAGRQPVQATTADLTAFPEGDAVRLQDGTLAKAEGQPEVYVISEGVRRPITNEATFKAMKWEWSDVEVVDEDTLNVHPLGLAFTLSNDVEIASE